MKLRWESWSKEIHKTLRRSRLAANILFSFLSFLWLHRSLFDNLSRSAEDVVTIWNMRVNHARLNRNRAFPYPQNMVLGWSGRFTRNQWFYSTCNDNNRNDGSLFVVTVCSHDFPPTIRYCRDLVSPKRRGTWSHPILHRALDSLKLDRWSSCLHRKLGSSWKHDNHRC